MADPRILSLSILLDPTGKDFLQHLYDGVIENVEHSTLSGILKNRDLSGEPSSGSVEAKRFANAKSNSYGTARAAGAGAHVKAKPVIIQIDQDREIVEEIEYKDTVLYGVDGLLTRRSANHVRSMVRELERAFFQEAVTAGTTYTSTKTLPNEILESLILQLETVQNDYVDGVPRDMISVVLAPETYSEVRNFLDTSVNNANVNTAIGEFGRFHGVPVYSSIYLPAGVKRLALIQTAVAQPVLPRPYTAEKIPLSEAYAVELFYYFGTKAVTPDLIFSMS